MTVQCPRCGTQYRVADARLSEPRPVFKCTRCNHVFARGERPSARAGGRGGESRNLSLPFGAPGDRRAGPEPAADDLDDEEDADEEALAGDDIVEETDTDDVADPGEARSDEPESEGDEALAARVPRRGRARAAEPGPGGDDPAFVADLPRSRERERPASSGTAAAPAASRKEPRVTARPEAKRGAPPVEDAPDVEDDDGPLLIAEAHAARRSPIQPRTRRSPMLPARSPLKPIAIGVGAIVSSFLVFAVVLHQRPELAFEQLGAVPLLGRLLGDDHLLVWRLQIGGIESSMDHIRGDRPALVVSGNVLNTTNQTLRLIEIEGLLLSDGVERQRKVVYAANQFRKTIRDLSASEVEMLLRLEPNRRFAVRPGESVGFLIVFADPPASATEVTCRVVAAQPA